MIDKVKVIKGLECCANDKPFYHAHCDECPYNGRKLDNMGGCTKLYRDALELLKEQEPKLVDNIQIRTLDTVGDCPSCGIGVSKRYHPMHCGLCGQAVKWDE